MPGGKRRPSFKMVSNMVIQLLHSIKYSVEVPFSNMAQQPMEIQKTTVAKKVGKERKGEQTLSVFFVPNIYFVFDRCILFIPPTSSAEGMFWEDRLVGPGCVVVVIVAM